MTMNTMIGIDLAKSVFQFHVATMTGEVLLRRKLPRGKVHQFMAAQEPAVVVMEACGSAHYWAREFRCMGHVVKLIAPQYVRPFVKRQKNDAADAEAIVVAAQRPEMRFIEPKTQEQQAKAVLFRSRGRLVNQRTEVINGLRSVLYEFGHVVPQRTVHLPLIREIVEAPNCDLPELAREECRDMLDQIDKLNERIDAKTIKIKSEALKTPVARRLETVPGVGPITALAIEAYAPPMEVFHNGRAFAAWLGLVPRQHSSGGKERLGRMTKAGQADIRKLLINGAMSRLTWLGRKTIRPDSWLGRMLARKPIMLVAIALANRMARQIWSMLMKGEDYRNPASLAAA
jgi:transposase